MKLFRWLIPIVMGVSLLAPVRAVAQTIPSTQQPVPRETLDYAIDADAGIGNLSVKKTLSGRVIKEKGNSSKILDYTSYTPLVHFIKNIVDSTYVHMRCEGNEIHLESHRYKYVGFKLEEYFTARRTFPYEERFDIAYYLLARTSSMRTVGELDDIERDYPRAFHGGQILHAVIKDFPFEIKRKDTLESGQRFITLVVSSRGLGLNNILWSYQVNGSMDNPSREDSLIPCDGSGDRGIFKVRTRMKYK